MNQGDFVGPAALSDKSRIFFGLFSPLFCFWVTPVWGVAPEQDHAPCDFAEIRMALVGRGLCICLPFRWMRTGR